MTWLSRAGRRGCVSMYKHPICAVWVVCVRLNFQQRYLFLHSHWFCTTDFTLRLLAKWNSWAKVLDVQAYHPDIKYISGNRFYLLFFCAFFLSFLEKGQSEACVCYGIQQTFVGFLNVIVKVWGGGEERVLCVLRHVTSMLEAELLEVFVLASADLDLNKAFYQKTLLVSSTVKKMTEAKVIQRIGICKQPLDSFIAF